MGFTQISLGPRDVESAPNTHSISQITRWAKEEGQGGPERLQARKEGTDMASPFPLLAEIQERHVKSQASLQG